MNKSYSEIGNNLVNYILFAIVLTFIPNIVMLIYRTISTGFTMNNLTLSLMFILVVGLYFIRHKLSLKTKGYTILILLMINGLSNFYAYGLLSMGVSNLLFLIVVATLITDRKLWLSFMVFSTGIFLVYAYLYTQGILTLDFDVKAYAIAPSTWGVQFVGFLSYQLMIAFSISYLVSNLIETHGEKEQLILNEKDKLEKLVKARTIQLENTLQGVIRDEKVATLDSLVKGVSHSVNTPLGVAFSSVSFLDFKIEELLCAFNENKLSKGDFVNSLNSIKESTEMISSGIESAVKAMNNFKDISIGREDIIKKPFELSEVIESVIISLRANYQHLNFDVDMLCEEELWIYSNPRLFIQLANQLITNSILHGIVDDRNIKILFSISLKDNVYELVCEDDGKGIEDDRIEHIYEPFYNQDISKGSGLGLSNVYNIVTNLLKGRIELEKNEEKGTKFIIAIPREALENHLK